MPRMSQEQLIQLRIRGIVNDLAWALDDRNSYPTPSDVGFRMERLLYAVLGLYPEWGYGPPPGDTAS